MSKKHIPWFNPLYEVDDLLQGSSSDLEALASAFHMLGQEKVSNQLWTVSDALQQSRQIIKDVIDGKLQQDSKAASDGLGLALELALSSLLPKEKQK